MSDLTLQWQEKAVSPLVRDKPRLFCLNRSWQNRRIAFGATSEREGALFLLYGLYRGWTFSAYPNWVSDPRNWKPNDLQMPGTEAD